MRSSVYVCVLLCIVGTSVGQLLIAVPNTTKPSDQIFSPSYLSKYNRGYGSITPSVIASASSDSYGAKTKLDPNGGLTITIKLQPQALAMLQSTQQQQHQQQFNSIPHSHSQQSSVGFGQPWDAPYPQKPNIQYHNYNPRNNRHRQQQQQQQQYAFARKTPYGDDNSYSGQGSQGQGHEGSFSDLSTQQLPPLPEVDEKPTSTSSAYDILNPIHLNNLIKEAMKEKEQPTEDKEEEPPMIVNVASAVVKNVKDIPSNIDLMFNDMGSAYRKTLFYVRDSIKDKNLFGWMRGSKRPKETSGFLDAYGV